MKSSKLFPFRSFVLTVAAVILVTLWPVLPPASADSMLTSIPVGSPSAVAVNPATNQIYVTNADSNTLTVIDGATDTVSRVIPVGSDPEAVAVDAATGDIYVACYASDNIMAIDVADQTMNSIGLGFSPLSMAVDQAADKVYAVGSNNMAVIDGTTHTVSSINISGTLKSLTVDQATGKVYLVNDAAVITLDPASDLTSILYSGAAPVAVAVNPDTDKIYAVNLGNDSVAAINEFGNISTVAVGSDPVAAAVDPATNMIYVANNGSNSVTVIDGATDMTTSIGVGAHPVSLVVNPATDLIYVACEGGNELTVIAGSAAVLPVPSGANPPGAPGAAAGAPATPTVISLAIGQTGYTVNGAIYTLDAAPLLYDGRTLIPIRDVAATLGASVSWDATEQKVTVAVNDKTIVLWVGQGTAKVNGTTVPIDADNPGVMPILAPPGRVMLPLRFISENLGCQVDWNPSLQVITVTGTNP